MKMIGNNTYQLPIQVLPDTEERKNRKEIGSANMLINQIPNMITAEQLSKSYKVIFPKGVTGILMEIKNGANAGLNTTSIIGESSKIVGQGGLQSLSNLASPLAVFSVVSMITGQYFMAQINQSIKALTENIEEVQRQIDTTQEALVFSSTIFLQEIKNDWTIILESESYKNSIISNIITTINNLTSQIYYFENRLNSKINELKILLEKNKIADNSLRNELERNKDFLKLAYETRSCLKLIVLFLSSNITEKNAEDIKSALNTDDDVLFSNTVKQLDYRIDIIINQLKNASNIKMQQQSIEIKSIITDIREITRDRYNNSVKANIESTIENIRELDSKGKTFYIERDKLYIEE